MLDDEAAWDEALRLGRLTWVRVVCTGRGGHGEIRFPDVALDGDEVREQLSRQRPAPWGSGATIGTGDEALAAPGRYTDVAEARVTVNRRGESAGRWRCPRCGVDARLSGERLRLAVVHYGDTPERRLDVSQLPR